MGMIADRLARLIAKEVLRQLHQEVVPLAKELQQTTDHLERCLNKIDTMVVRSDARVDNINHMVDNCLELSRKMATTLDNASSIVRENSVALTKAVESHSSTEALYAESVRALQSRCDRLQNSLTKEQENISRIETSISEVKQTLNHIVSASLRPNVNINPKQ